MRAAAAREPDAVHRRAPGAARVPRRQLLRDRLHVPGRPGRDGIALLDRAYPQASRGGRARRLRARVPDRRAPGAGARLHPDDPGDRRGAHAPGPALAAHLHQPERAHRRVPGRACDRGDDRRGGHHGEPVPGPGKHRRPASARPVRRHPAAHRGRALSQGHRQGAAEDDVQDGHLGGRILSRRLQLRGDRPIAGVGGGVLPGHAVAHFRHRAVGSRAQRARAARGGLERRGDHAAGGRAVQAASSRRGARLRWRPDPHVADGLRHRQLHHVQALCRCGAASEARRVTRPTRLPRGPHADPGRGCREHHRDPQAVAGTGHFPRSPRSGSARDLVDRDEPHRRALGQRRGRRGPGTLEAARQRRQRVLGDQADRVRPVRRHRAVPERLPRDRDQDGAGAPSPARAASCPASR